MVRGCAIFEGTFFMIDFGFMGMVLSCFGISGFMGIVVRKNSFIGELAFPDL